jgi:hypothetical protein
LGGWDGWVLILVVVLVVSDGSPLQWMVLVYATAALPRMWVMALVVTEALSDLRVLAAELGRLHGWVVSGCAGRAVALTNVWGM